MIDNDYVPEGLDSMLPLPVRFFLLLLPLAASTAGANVEFNREVRPILSDKCFVCHGPDSVAKKIPLRLDREETAKSDLGGGRRAIVEGDAAASGVVQRITAEQPARRMPPVYSGLKLSAKEIEILRTWIAQGAKWQPHWSFIPPKRHAAPKVTDASWPRNPIDYFVLERLEREGLTPSPEASRETLIRRVSLDLTGLPPTIAEVDAFLSDTSPGAYEKVVDRLLASPRYGEHMAAAWLGAARYADTNGYQYDGERFMWRWRDWVIEAFNRNKPFDRFAVEQIAGDLLPDATLDQKIATGFNRNHRINTEDGLVPEEYAVEYVVDRVDTTSTVFMGLTLGCARCHNHKYDPITQKEFYQVYAYFNNIPELGRGMKYGNSPPVMPAPTREQQRQHAELQARIDAVEQTFVQKEDSIAAAQAAWEDSLKSSAPLYWAPAAGLDAAINFDGRLPYGEGPEAPEDGKPLETYQDAAGRIGRAGQFDGRTTLELGNLGRFDIEDRFTLAAWVYSEGTPDGPVVTRMVDRPKGKGYGLHVNQGKVHVHLTSNWDDDAIRVESEQMLAPGRWHHLLVTYTGSRMAEGITLYIDGKPAKIQVLLDTLYRPFRNAGRQFREPLRIGGGWGPERSFQGRIDEVRVYGRILEGDEIAVLAQGASLNELAGKPRQQRTAPEKLQLRSYFLETAAAPEIRDSWKRLADLRLDQYKLERSFPTVMVMAEQSVPKDTFLLIRGAYDKPGEKVQPGLPSVLPPLPEGAPNNRLGFARWLVDPANPLTARVTVNRFWQSYFGTGLVKTTEDFGVQGEWPSHPELLDWLATEFVRTGWDTKAMQRLIVTSAAYRQSSRATPELLQRDPENRLLARGPRQRLSAEAIRDQALLISGLLAEKIGGRSVKPYQPAGLWKEISMQDMDYEQAKGEDLYRRGLYTFWKRTIAPPMLSNFDAAMRESCVVRETRTNTPLQALNLMNDVTFIEAARFLGQRMMTEGGADSASRLAYGFRLVTARTPSSRERQVLLDSLGYHLDYFAEAKNAEVFLTHGDSAADPSLGKRELAAYTAVASLLLNLDEAMTKE